MRVKTLLADEADLALAGLRAILSDVPRVDLLGEVRDAEALLEVVRRDRPHVVLIDHTASSLGADAVRDARKVSKRTRFVAITNDPSPVVLAHALRSGVVSYVRKDCDRAEIVNAVLDTADGSRFFCGKVLAALERSELSLEKLCDRELGCTAVTLTARECEVVRLIADGLSYTRIADRLGVSAHTVTTHRRNIMQKAGVNSTAALVMYAVKHGLTSPNRYLFGAVPA
ncbi:MAG: response regulator transcription factor [Flavobacteriales bacterium]|nr:Response regulator UvrY [Flavobacteriales bacterium]MCC6578621.1 response regulator transcription factor [Flavobacteriales bacterium]NUQ16539.1 response regulator transcription factor [Flavobacteriales bacterium]